MLRKLINFPFKAQKNQTYEGALIAIHTWCQGNIESKGCDDITPFCIEVRDLIEKTGVIK